MPKQIAVLISGQGSNLAALHAANIAVGVVIADRDCPGIEYARTQGLATAVICPDAFPNQESCDQAVATTIAAYHCDLVVLAGYQRILGPQFCQAFAGKAINLHPSLLPKYPGLDTHARVLANGDNQHGCSVHWLSEQVDQGKVIAQTSIVVLPDDDAKTLAARVQAQEHKLLPQVVTEILLDKISYA